MGARKLGALNEVVAGLKLRTRLGEVALGGELPTLLEERQRRCGVAPLRAGGRNACAERPDGAHEHESEGAMPRRHTT